MLGGGYPAYMPPCTSPGGIYGLYIASVYTPWSVHVRHAVIVGQLM